MDEKDVVGLPCFSAHIAAAVKGNPVTASSGWLAWTSSHSLFSRPSILPSCLCVLRCTVGGDGEGDGQKIRAKEHERKSRMELGMGGVPFYWILLHKSMFFFWIPLYFACIKFLGRSPPWGHCYTMLCKFKAIQVGWGWLNGLIAHTRSLYGHVCLINETEC